MRRAWVMVTFSLLPTLAGGSKLSEALEKAIGQLAALEIEAQFGRVRDPLLEGYIYTLGQELAFVSGRDIRFHFRVLDTEIVNAFAAPYGYVYVTKGLLRFVGSEDELAGVIGHEVGHVACRHSWRMIKTSLAIDLLLSTLKNRRWRGFKGVARIASLLYLLRHSRKHEYQADEMGVAYCYLAGYDPRGVADFLHRLDSRYPRRPSKFELILSTHPLTSERIKRARGHLYAKAEEAKVLVRIGDGYASRGYLRRAVEFYEEAKEKAPQDPGVRARLAAAYALLAQPEKAEQEREALASLQPKDPELLSLLPQVREVALRTTERRREFSPLPPKEREEMEKKIAQAERGIEEARRRAEATSRAFPHLFEEAEENWRMAAGALDSFSRALAEEDSLGFSIFNSAASFLELSHRALEKAEQSKEELELLAEALLGRARLVREALRATVPAEGRNALRRAVDTLSEAAGLFREATGRLEAEFPQICRGVGKSASHVERLVTSLGLFPGRPRQVVEMAVAKLESTSGMVKEAYQRATEVQRACASLRIASVGTALNLSTVGFYPPHEQRAKVIVARFLGVREEDVERLRELGWPYGDVVMALALVRARGASDPIEALRTVPEGGGWARKFGEKGIDLDEFGLLLGLMEKEWREEFL